MSKNSNVHFDRRRLLMGAAATTAIVSTPSIVRAQAKALGYSQGGFNPNNQNQGSVRANTNIRVNATISVQANVSYMSTYMDDARIHLSAISRPITIS